MTPTNSPLNIFLNTHLKIWSRMRKQLLKIIQEVQADIKELECIVQPARSANDADGKIVVEVIFMVARNAIMKASFDKMYKVIDRYRRQNIVPNRHNRTRKKQRLTRLQRRAKRQK